MTKQEAGKLILEIQTIYPEFLKDAGAEQIMRTTTAWAMTFGEMDFHTAEEGFWSFARHDAKGFPPKPGQIIAETIKRHPEEDLPGDLEAWSMVRRAIRNGTYGAEEEFAKLPPAVQEAVATPTQIRSWAGTPTEQVDTVCMSQFLRVYRGVRQRMNDERALPKSARIYTQLVTERVQTPQIEEKHEEPEGIPLPEKYRKLLEEKGLA